VGLGFHILCTTEVALAVFRTEELHCLSCMHYDLVKILADVMVVRVNRLRLVIVLSADCKYNISIMSLLVDTLLKASALANS
jgi:hypothetical protein